MITLGRPSSKEIKVFSQTLFLTIGREIGIHGIKMIA